MNFLHQAHAAWTPVASRGSAAVRAYLSGLEPVGCNLADRLYHGTPASRREHILYQWGSDDSIQALWYRNIYGLSLPILSTDAQPPCPPEARGLFAVVGRTRDAQPFFTWCGQPRIHWRYLSMNMPAPTAQGNVISHALSQVPDFSKTEGESWQNVLLRPARTSDLEALMPLQCAYEVEEVLIPGTPLRTDGVRMGLLQSIKLGQIVIAESGGKPVAKAGINATGIRWAQIGGVYTLPAWRKHGVASVLMNFLVRSMFNSGWGLTLFVKTGNAAAIRVYRKLGFSGDEPFSVAYY